MISALGRAMRAGSTSRNASLRRWRRAPLVLGLLFCGSCKGPFSTLDTAGGDAAEIAELFWWMAGGGTLIWLVVMGIALWAIRSREHSPKKTRALVIGGGTLFPLVVLTVLLAFGLAKVPALLKEGSPDAPRLRVTGERFWWRVEYSLPDGRTFETANEIRLPVGQRVEVKVESADVVHSFWIPALHGKIDMIPGRTNRIALSPTRTGKFGGWCAEYCGLAHAKMRLDVVVEQPGDFARWTESQLSAAVPSSKRGSEIFQSTGCGACHTVRGTEADGRIGPDLTHVAGRVSLGAGILRNDAEGFRTVLTQLPVHKPEVQMPTFDMLPESDLQALSAYLEGLK